MLYRPEITDELVAQVNGMIEQHPEYNRYMLSWELCKLWDWRFPSGDLKTMSCRTFMAVLEKKGLIKLPESQRKNTGGSKSTTKNIEHDTTPVQCSLQSLLPLSIEVVEKLDTYAAFKSYINQYHYLGFYRTIGENMQYLIRSKDGVPLSCMLFGSSAWSCKDRDKYIGWNSESRKKWLQYTTNNVRFLIFPWVKIPHLASHILSVISKRISNDWIDKYGHPIYLLETFVEKDRFKGTCYKAANWKYVGETTGKGRNSTKDTPILPIKEIYLYPLDKGFKKKLTMKEVIE